MCACCEIPKVPKAAQVLTWPFIKSGHQIPIDFTWGLWLWKEAIRTSWLRVKGELRGAAALAPETVCISGPLKMFMVWRETLWAPKYEEKMKKSN